MAKREHKGNKRRISYILASAAIIIVIIIAVVIFFYFGANSEEKKQYESQIKQQSQTFIDDLISELDQVDTSDQGLAAENTGNGESSSSEVPAEINTNSEKRIIGEELAKLNDAKKQQVLQTLSVSYSRVLNEQKAEALNMAASLIGQGKADWAELVAKGENTTANKVKLASEYLARSKAMESQMDASFSALMQKMEEQLKAEGIDPTNIIAGYQAEYEKIKAQNKKEMMDKAMAAMKQR
ncbi:MAG TPA: hypothetical protein VM577_05125 [Anaerovoracaceae bacterium]|nr:hypothetical protein [Anaerovoracaceae bacterium]